MKNLETGCLLSGLTLPLSNKTINTGTTTTATNIEPIIANVFVHTNGENNFFSCPSRNRMGLKETSVIKIELTTALAINFDELSILCSLSCFVSILFCFTTYCFHCIFHHYNSSINQISNSQCDTGQRHDI